MGTFTITFGNQNHQFTTNLSNAKSKFFTHWGTNIQGSVITQNSITVTKKEDYDFVLNAFTALAKRDGNAKDITDKDFAGIDCGENAQNCLSNGSKFKENIWHSDDYGEYNYHSKEPKNGGVKQAICLSDHEDYGV